MNMNIYDEKLISLRESSLDSTEFQSNSKIHLATMAKNKKIIMNIKIISFYFILICRSRMFPLKNL